MASFFGEIIEPSTRAIFDEFSDDEDDFKETELHLSWAKGDNKLPSVLDVIFFIHGRLSLAFAEAHLIEEKSSPVAEITITETDRDVEREVEYHHNRNIPSRIYINRNTAICLVSPSFSGELGYQFTEIMAPLLKISKKVIVFTNDSVYNFKTPAMYELPPAFVKELKTSYNMDKDKASLLPSPNFITGIPAAVISWCQIFKKDASAFICYTDQQKLDSVTASPYLSVLKKLSYKVIVNENPDFNKKLFYGKPEIVGGSSNIYI